MRAWVRDLRSRVSHKRPAALGLQQCSLLLCEGADYCVTFTIDPERVRIEDGDQRDREEPRATCLIRASADTLWKLIAGATPLSELEVALIGDISAFTTFCGVVQSALSPINLRCSAMSTHRKGDSSVT